MKKDKAPQKDLGGGKWVMDVQYSRKGKTPMPTFFLGSEAGIKTLKSSIPVLYQKISSVEASIRAHEKVVSDLRKQEILLLNSPHNSSDLKSLVAKIQRHKGKIKKFQNQLVSLKSDLSSMYANSKNTFKNETTLSPVSSPKKTVYPLISVGDCLYHSTHENGLVYSVKDTGFNVYFEDSQVIRFLRQDPAFDKGQLTLKYHWDAHKKCYTPRIHHSSTTISSDLNNEYSHFLSYQYADLKNFISELFNRAGNYSLKYYAQCALASIYNIEHSDKVFLSLHSKKGVAPSKAPKTASIASELASPSSAPTFPSIQYKPSSDTLYVYSGRIKCIRDNHTMTCVNALIDTASGEVAKLNVNCCLTCNRFYISYDEYERYMAKYKSLLTRIVLVNQNGESTFANNLAAESILKLCGYSVSQEKGLSQAERQRLLAKIIHAGIVNKPDVIQHLNWLIKMNGKKAGNDIAKEKWEDDLFFVRNLDMRSQTNHKISSVSPYSSKKTKKRY